MLNFGSIPVSAPTIFTTEDLLFLFLLAGLGGGGPFGELLDEPCFRKALSSRVLTEARLGDLLITTEPRLRRVIRET